MEAAHNNAKQLDVVKVFEAIAAIISRRGEGNVRMVSVKERPEDAKDIRKAG